MVYNYTLETVSKVNTFFRNIPQIVNILILNFCSFYKPKNGFYSKMGLNNGKCEIYIILTLK